MITLTNDLGLPLPIAAWLLNDDYDYNADPTVFSATSLIKPIKKSMLGSAVARSDSIELQIDISTKLSSIRGQNLHFAIEKSCDSPEHLQRVSSTLGMPIPEIIMEKRLHAQIEVRGKTYTVSGKFDAIIDKILHDWKTEQTYSFNDPIKHRDRILQLSIYAWLCYKNNIDIDFTKGVYYSVYQNFIKGLAVTENYPSSAFNPVEVELLPMGQIEFWIKDKIEERIDLSIEDVDSIECTRQDLWMDDPVWQYFPKPDAKRASKNFEGASAETEAQAFLASKGHKGYIKQKPSFAKACEYCAGAPICSQYDSLNRQGLIKNEVNAISLRSDF